MNKRLFISIIIFALILVAPFWLYLPPLFVAVIFLPFYWEGLVFGFVIDVLYGSRAHETLNLGFPIAIAVFILLLLSLPIRERLRINA